MRIETGYAQPVCSFGACERPCCGANVPGVADASEEEYALRRQVLWDGLTPRHFAAELEAEAAFTEDEYAWFDCTIEAPGQLHALGLRPSELEREERIVRFLAQVMLDLRAHVEDREASPRRSYTVVARDTSVGERRLRDLRRGTAWPTYRSAMALRFYVPFLKAEPDPDRGTGN